MASRLVTVELWNHTMTTKLADLTASTGNKFDIAHNEAGSFNLVISRRAALDAMRIQNQSSACVLVKLDGVAIKHYLIGTNDELLLTNNNESDLTLAVTGLGSEGTLEDGKIIQPNGIGSEPPASTVYFNYAHPECDWPTATPAVVRNVVGNPLGNPPNGLNGRPYNFPNFLACWIAPTVGSGSDPVGSWYTRRRMFLAGPGKLTGYCTADDLYQMWYDGVQVSSFVEAPGDAAGTTFYFQIDAAAGWHTWVARVENLPRLTPNNCGIFAFACDDANTAYPNNWVSYTDGNWECVATTDTPPGFTITKAVRLLLEPIQALGKLTHVTLDCSDTTDSGGNTLPIWSEITAKVGTGFFTTLRGYAELGMLDFAFKRSTQELRIWDGGKRGTFWQNPTSPPKVVGTPYGRVHAVPAGATSVRAQRKRV